MTTPGDVTRKAFLDRIAADHPEVAQTVSQMGTPPVYVPPPLGFAASGYAQQPAYGGYGQQPGYGAQAQPPTQPSEDARPPMVNPRLVKY